jgi:D-aminoacyl-tRNA deacylase
VRLADADEGAPPVGRIGPGLLVLLGVTHEDGDAEVAWLADKIAGLRVFVDDAGKLNLSVTDVGGEVLLVPQFTLYADLGRGRRPGFAAAARPDVAEPRVEAVGARLNEHGLTVALGAFGRAMHVELINDGPVTLWLDSADR